MTTINVHPRPMTKIRLSFDLLDRIEIETTDQHIVFHINPSSAHVAAEAGASLLASACQQSHR